MRQVALDVLVGAAWAWCLTAWCMCFYILCASREGFRWFRPAHNPWLLLSAVAPLLLRAVCAAPWASGDAAVAASWCAAARAPTRGAVLFAAAVWALYAALVSHQRRRQLRVHVAPVCLPIAVLGAAYHALGRVA